MGSGERNEFDIAVPGLDCKRSGILCGLFCSVMDEHCFTPYLLLRQFISLRNAMTPEQNFPIAPQLTILRPSTVPKRIGMPVRRNRPNNCVCACPQPASSVVFRSQFREQRL